LVGAIAGDVIGSVHEWAGTKTKDFPLFVPQSTFTDDSVLTVAVAEWILTGEDLVDLLHTYYHNYSGRGYGGMFHDWAFHRLRQPYNSFGNGAAMRVSPVGFAFDTIEEVLAWAEQSAAVTHNHPEGIRGAQATAAAIYLARRGQDKDQIRRSLESQFGYDLSARLDQIRPMYRFNETCQGTVPQALAAFVLRVNELRGCHTQCHLAGWGCRHPGVYYRRYRRGLLWWSAPPSGSAGSDDAGRASGRSG